VTVINAIQQKLNARTNIAPLVIFRIAFGVLMLLSTLRFMLKGWVYTMYIQPKVHFPFWGFEWIKALPPTLMYAVFILLLLSCVGIILGAMYRLSAVLFFVLFTYVELIDKTNYLNHYYFVSLVAFSLVFLPCAKNFSLDNKWFKRAEQREIPYAYTFVIQFQLFLVYFFAGVAKINSDWLLEAQPLRIWLPAFSHYPIIGKYMEADWVACLFCWFGCLYDLSIGFLLFNKRTTTIAYVFVVIFHAATALFFNIGMFPYIMMTITIIFFKTDFHVRLLTLLKENLNYTNHTIDNRILQFNKSLSLLFSVFFVIQILLPFRYLLYSGKLFWTEQGYRFSWRVMLMEKAGTSFFYVRDTLNGKVFNIDNKDYLSFMQEKMMSTQPDMMVDYARFLKQDFMQKGLSNIIVTAESYVTVNGSGSLEFIDSTVDLSNESNSIFKNKTWVKSY
jgi:hypothetical protein